MSSSATSNAPSRSACLLQKTDPSARGCVRTWGCICSLGDGWPCPFHALRVHCAYLDSLLGTDLSCQTPIFPTRLGKIPSKVGVVKASNNVAAALGLELRDSLGRQRFTGHSLRVIGAQFLTGYLELSEIQLLGRWSSQVVERYVREAPLSVLTSSFLSSASSCSIPARAQMLEP